MVDRITPEARSRNMARVRGKDTGPEMRVRRVLHALGYRFRIHVPDLPGKPDLVFTRRRKVVFVHGCFWHRHPGCRRAAMPASRTEFWERKFRLNRARDETALRELAGRGWETLTVWECQTEDPANLTRRLVAFLGNPRT